MLLCGLCCFVLCYIELCCGMLYFVKLCCGMPVYIVLSCVVLFCFVLCNCYLVLYRFFIASVRIPEQYTTVCSKLLLSYSNSLWETFLVCDFAFLVSLVAIIIIKSYLMRCHTYDTHGVLKLHLSAVVHPVHATNYILLTSKNLTV